MKALSLSVSMSELPMLLEFPIVQSLIMGWDGAVGTANRYGLDGPVIESR